MIINIECAESWATYAKNIADVTIDEITDTAW